MDDKIFKALAEFGKKYQDRYLYSQCEKEKLKTLLTTDWYEALKFFFDRSFMRGRRDELSNTFLERTLNVLNGFFKEIKIEELGQNQVWKENLLDKLEKAGVNNKTDRKMVVSNIDFIIKIDGNNLINYTLEKIDNHKIQEIYNELYNEPDGICGVGDKIASFFLRDLVCIFDRENELKKNEEIFLQPIDTWVGKVSKKLLQLDKPHIEKALSGNKKSLQSLKEAKI
ncbi:MAG: hypothetical protein QXH07_03180 [Thermoplasmata archaeon]